MSNEEIYKKLEEDFTKLNLLNFCIIRSKESLILYIEDQKTHNLPSEHEYNCMWWDEKYYNLKKELRNENK